MKRVAALLLLICMLFVACDSAEKADKKESTKAQTQPASETAEETVEESVDDTLAQEQEDTTQPETLPQPELVTVYLLDEIVIFDYGITKFTYDENYNMASYQNISLEKEVLYEALFSQSDANGMPSQFAGQYPGAETTEVHRLSWNENGTLQEEQYDPGFSGYQYAFDGYGQVVEKREYYDGILESTVYYEYQGQTLCGAYAEDPEGNKIFECRVENGLIMEKTYKDSSDSYSFIYEYDQHGNVVKSTVNYGGEILPDCQYSYIEVQVPAQRVPYLLGQQRYVLYIA